MASLLGKGGRGTGTGDESLQFVERAGSATGGMLAPNSSGGEASLLINTSNTTGLHQQQSLSIPVSSSTSQVLRKVLVKPIAPKQQGLPMGVVSGLVTTPSNASQNVLTSTTDQLGGGFNHNNYVQSLSSSVHLPPPPPPPPTSGVAMTMEQERKVTPLPPPSQPVVKPKRRTSSQSSGSGVNAAANKPRKPCNCKNSQCLKLYCDCFANGEFCRDSCNCQNCKNSFQHEEDRSRAVKACLERNPNAFKPKVGHGRAGDERRHIKGCNCKKSSCLKNYCECYEAKIPCSHLCRCVGCQNLADRPEGKGLMQLANAADLRTQQQKAASTHFLDQLDFFIPPYTNRLPEERQRLPYSFVNKDVTKATTLCLLEEASHCASSGKSPVDVERAVLIEFGRCLEQIINSSESANQAHRETVTGKV